MNITSKGILIGTLVLVLGSCAKDDGWNDLSGEKGGISLNLSADGRVMNLTRSDDGMSPVVPEVSAFGIGLHKNDGSYSKTWSRVEDFHKETEFPIGDYDIEATYGDIEKEGFENPYYYGTTPVHVSPNANSKVSIVATLANAMVSFRYTAAFKSYFMAYNGAVQTPGHDYVLFSQDEERPAYIKPSDVNVSLTLTNGQGKTVTVQPAGFTAEPRHHYVVTFNVSADPQGGMVLDVQFDDSVIGETVDVPLGDELWDTPAPEVTANGFVSDVENNAFEQIQYTQDAKFHVFALGGLKEANLNIISNTQYVPDFGERIDLMKAGTLQQQQLEQSGLGCYGFYRNPDKMAVLDLQGFIGHLPVGQHKISLEVVDKLTRVSNIETFIVNVNPITIEMYPGASVPFQSTQATVVICTNCLDIQGEISFEAPGANGSFEPVKILSQSIIDPPAGTSLPYAIRYRLEVSEMTSSEVDIKGILGTKQFDAKLPVQAPVYNITVDAYARKAEFHIENATPALTEYIAANGKVYFEGGLVSSVNINNDIEGGIITVTGLQGSQDYSGYQLKVGGFYKDVEKFTTENPNDEINGNFSNLVNTINRPINAGGSWKYTALGSSTYNHTRIEVSEPAGWASLNQKTCYEGSSVENTWFMVPSTMMESNREVLIRSVYYDHYGKLPAEDYFSNIRKKFSRNSPSAFAGNSPGELFLGSYSFDGTETRTNGIEFHSRPSTFSFTYNASPINGEHGAFEITVYGAGDEVLSTVSQDLTASGQDTDVTINMPTYPVGKKAEKLYIRFISSTASPVTAIIPSGDALDDVTTLATATGAQTIPTNAYKSLAVGSQLRIKNVHLGYEVSNITGKSLRK